MRVEIPAVWNEVGDLPTAGGVLIDEGLVDTQLLCNLLGCHLAGAINEQLGADARVAVDVLAAVGCKVAGEVCETLLEGVDIVNLDLGTTEDIDDVVENLRVDVLEEVGIEDAQLIEGVELIDDTGGVGTQHHVELLDVLDIEIFPELVRGLRKGVLVIENLGEAL